MQLHDEPKILLIDDEPQIVELFSKVLRTNGFQVFKAHSGLQGLALAKLNCPDVVLIDVRMPDISGIDVCRQIKIEPALADVLVFIFSGQATSPAEKVDGFEVGADDYLVKPLDPRELVTRIRLALRLRDATAKLRESADYHKQLAEALRVAEAKYRTIFEQAAEGIFQTTRSGKLFNANPALARMLGYETPQELMRSIDNIAHIYVNAERREAMYRLLDEKGSILDFELALRRKDGRHIWVSVNAHFVRNAEGVVIYTEGTNLNITERKRLEEAILRVSDRQLQLVAHDIHDGICQRLFSIAVGCNLLREDLAAQSRPEAEDLDRIQTQLNDAIKEARNLARGLSLANMESQDLVSALRDLAATTSSDCRIPCSVECGDLITIKSPMTAQHLYRIAQEAMHNASRHAKPSQITIRLTSSTDGGRLVIMDNGIGIPEVRRSGCGMGLDSMRYRAKIIGGELSIENAPFAGTIVTCVYSNSILCHSYPE